MLPFGFRKLCDSHVIPVLTPSQAGLGSSTCYLLVVLTVNNPNVGL